jgi:hypothetical protein
MHTGFLLKVKDGSLLKVKLVDNGVSGSGTARCQ